MTGGAKSPMATGLSGFRGRGNCSWAGISPLRLFREDYRLDDVGQVKTVQVHHHRQQHAPVFADAEGADGIIHGLLAVLDNNLYPAGIPDRHHIRVVAPDAQRGG